MGHQKLLLEVREEFIWLVRSVESSAAMSLFDIHRIAEKIVLPLFQTIMGWPDLRNLNEEEEGFPAIDLGDDVEHIGIQVTGTTDLEKVKGTLETFLKHDLDDTYKRVIVYVLTDKQRSYKQASIDKVTSSRLTFNSKKDVLDYKDLLKKVAKLEPAEVEAVLALLKSYRLSKDPAQRPTWLIRTETSLAESVPFTPRWLFFAERKIPLLGRDEELTLLKAFMEAPAPFSWWALSGPAGIGKTRLAHELELAYKEGWYCGFIDATNLPKAEQLQQVKRPTLLVFDYAARDSAALQSLLRLGCAVNGTPDLKLRILLLEREANEGVDWWRALVHGQGIAVTQIRNHQYAAPLELAALNTQTPTILRAWLNAGAPHVVTQLPKPESEFWTQVKDVSEGRPLLIALIAGAFSRAPQAPQVPVLRELLNPVLLREAQRWGKLCTDQSTLPRLVQLVAVATLTRGLNVLQADQRILIQKGGQQAELLVVKDSQTQKLRLPTFDDLRDDEDIFKLLSDQQQTLWTHLTGMIPSDHLPLTIKLALEECPPRGILQPDLIGEFFIDELWSQRLPFARITALPALSDELLESILSTAWKIQPYGLLETLDALKKTTTNTLGYIRLLSMLTGVACQSLTSAELAPNALSRVIFNSMVKTAAKRPEVAQLSQLATLLSMLTQRFSNDRAVAYRAFKGELHLSRDPVSREYNIDSARSLNLRFAGFITEMKQYPSDVFELCWADVISVVVGAALQGQDVQMLAEALHGADQLQEHFGGSSDVVSKLIAVYRATLNLLSEPKGNTYSLSAGITPFSKHCLPLLVAQMRRIVEEPSLDQTARSSMTWLLTDITFTFAKLQMPSSVFELRTDIERSIARINDAPGALAISAKHLFIVQTAYLLEHNLTSAMALLTELAPGLQLNYSDDAALCYLVMLDRMLEITLDARQAERFLDTCAKLFELYPLLSDDDRIVAILQKALDVVRQGSFVFDAEKPDLDKLPLTPPVGARQHNRCTDLFMANYLAARCAALKNDLLILDALEQLLTLARQRPSLSELFKYLDAALLHYWLFKGMPSALEVLGDCNMWMDGNFIQIRIRGKDGSNLSETTLETLQADSNLNR